jgi:hypothetical protein
VIRVKITARHRRVLMASHTLEKVQLAVGIGHPGQRRVSQAVHQGPSPGRPGDAGPRFAAGRAAYAEDLPFASSRTLIRE